MTGSAGRWEWRTFGPGARVAEHGWRDLAPVGTQESDETYLLSGAGETAKVRDGLMDIKALVEVDSHGLEQWNPVMKVAFPLVAADVGATFAALGLPAPPLARDAYTLDEFVERAGRASRADPRPVAVHKRRVRYVINGCTSEVTDVPSTAISGRTVAIESEDEEAVIGAVALGGAGGVRQHLLRRGPGGAARRHAAALRRHRRAGPTPSSSTSASDTADGGWRTMRDRAERHAPRRGPGGDRLDRRAAAERTAEAIAGMVAEAETRRRAGHRRGRDRRPPDREERRRRRRRDPAPRARPTSEVIPGEEESRLAYLAVKAGVGLAGGSLAVFDTGGGIHAADVRPRRHGRRALERRRGRGPVHGALRARGRRLARDPRRRRSRRSPTDLARLDGRPPVDALVGMGGAITNITAVKHGLATYDPDVVQGTVLDRAEIDRQIELYRSRDAAGRREIVGLQPKRADVILAGACIVRTVMDKLGRDSLTVSDRGLRHGLLVERFGG